MEVNKIDIQLSKLTKLLRNMDIPTHRKTKHTPENLKWLGKNIGVRNSNHKNYNEVTSILSEILQSINMLSNKETKSKVDI